MGIAHAKVLKFELDRTDHIMSNKTNAKLSVGFMKKGLLNGLGFTLITKASSTDPSTTERKADSFSIKPTDRGFFLNSQLTGMGEKWFKNGN